MVEPAAEGAVFREQAVQLRGYGNLALFGVRFEAEPGNRAQGSLGAGLHLLVHQQEVAASADGEERGAKGKAVDIAFDLESPAGSPELAHIEWNAGDDPFQ